MFSSQKDQLFLLIKSLNKSEKRNFKLYAKRTQGDNEAKFIQVFDVIDRLSEYDEDQLIKRLKSVEKKQLSNLKRHLYKQILISLRLIHIEKNIDIEIREQIDFARILYGKGMYMQSLRILDRISKIAYDNHQDLLHLEILEFQKLIEARHITRSRKVKNKMESLLQESHRRSRIAHITSKLSNLNIQIQGWYIQFGHIHGKREASVFKEYFNSNVADGILEMKLTFFENINLYQAYLWYYYVLLDFKKCLFYANRWVNLFNTELQMKDKDPDLYIRGLYYLLTFNYFMDEKEGFVNTLSKLETFLQESEEWLNPNSKMIAFVYFELSRLNLVFLEKNYQKGIKLIEEISKELPSIEAHTDPHRILLFYYKFACIHFCVGNFEKSLDYLNEIIHHKSELLNQELSISAQILHLICHFELASYDLLADYLIPSVKRSISRSKSYGRVHQLTLDFLKKITKLPNSEQEKEFQELNRKLEKVLENPIEQKHIINLDIPTWIASRLKGGNIESFQLMINEN